MEPSFPLRGELKVFSVNRLLQAILSEGIDGCLTVNRDSISRRLYIKGGMITYASSTERLDRIGEILIAQGLLTQADIEEALERGSPMRRLGMILLVDGKITPQQLFQGVSAQVVTILERMRSWRKGGYEFEVRREPKPGTVLLRIPLALYLGQAVRSGPPGPKENKTEVPVGLQLVDELEEDAPGTEKTAGTPTGGSDGGDDDLTVEELFEPGFPEASDEEELEITVEDDENDGGEDYGILDLPGSGGGAEDDALQQGKAIEEIAFHVQELRGRIAGGPHSILGLKDMATPEEIKKSFDYFSRILHPDKLPANLPPEIAGSAADMYKSVRAAYEKIGPQTLVRQHNFSPPPGRVPVSRQMPAEALEEEGQRPRRSFFIAKKLIAKGNYWQAAESLRDAVRQQPEEAEYRNLLGICLVQTGRRLHEAEEHIKEAIRLDPGNPDYVTSLGLAYKAGRFFKKARRMFEQALVYDKGHAQAKRELRNLPVDTERSDKSENIWSRLFGK